MCEPRTPLPLPRCAGRGEERAAGTRAAGRKMQYTLRVRPIRIAAAQTPSMLSWDDFRYVKAIADTRSLGGAAQELSVNHSTVSRRLAQIEAQLGSRLFERSRGGYALTPCGEEMVRLAERMGEDIVAFERQVTGHDLRPSG